MKEQDAKLTLTEIEQLCHLYMECRLNVLEETELQYVLTQVVFHSPLIDDVRGIMGITQTVAAGKKVTRRKLSFRKRMVYTGIAASIALLLGIGLTFFHTSSSRQDVSESYYIAYADGQRLDDEAAKAKIEAEIRAADKFIKEMSEIEAHEKQMIDNFITLNTL